MNTPVRILEQIRAVTQLVNAGAQKPALRITTNVPDAPLPVTASKFGGVPYLPAGVDAPLGSDGQPLGMIAQINCAELPENTLYPESGMLQFWIAPRPGWGADPTAPTSPPQQPGDILPRTYRPQSARPVGTYRLGGRQVS